MTTCTQDIWRRCLDEFQTSMNRYGSPPATYQTQFQQIASGGPDDLDNIFENIDTLLEPLVKGFQGKNEPEILQEPARPTLLASYYTVLVMYFPFSYSFQEALHSDTDLDDSDRTRMETLLTNLQIMERCLVEWIDESSSETLGDIKNTPREQRYNEASAKIGEFFNQAQQAQVSISNSLQSMNQTLDTFSHTMTLYNIIKTNCGIIREISGSLGQQAKQVQQHLKSGNLEGIKAYKALISDYYTRVEAALTTITELDLSWSNRTTFTTEQVDKFQELSSEQQQGLPPDQIQLMTRCMQEQSLWSQREQLTKFLEILQPL